MKIFIFFTMITLCIVFPKPSKAEYSFIDNIQGRGKNVVYQNVIREKELLSMPSWSPEDGEPPLSVKQAAEIAKNYAKAYLQKFDNSYVDAVKLHPFIYPYYFKDKWGYFITVQRVVDKDLTPSQWQFEMDNIPTTTYVLVMMDGSVHEPELVKR